MPRSSRKTKQRHRKSRGYRRLRVSHRKSRGTQSHRVFQKRTRKIKGGYTPTMRKCGSGLCSIGPRQTIVTHVDPDSDSVPQFVTQELAESMNENL